MQIPRFSGSLLDAIQHDETVRKYPFDFYLPKFNLVIEYQGRQHKFGWFNDADDASDIQKRDQLKRSFAISNGLHYLELDQTTKKALIQTLDSFVRSIADSSEIAMPSKPRELFEDELQEIETRFKWSYGSVKEAIDSCKSIKEFRKKYPTGYDYALKNDIWTELSSNLIKITHHGKYTKQYVTDVAVACSTRSEFKITNKGAWAAAQRNGWLDEVCSHMPKHIQRTKLD